MEQKEKQLPEMSIKIKIGRNTYNIDFPNNGQLIDIERKKIAYTSGTYKDMLLGVANATQQAFLLVETISTFEVLVPQLEADLTVKSLMDLNPYQTRDLIHQYTTVYYPWMQKWMEVINEKID